MAIYRMDRVTEGHRDQVRDLFQGLEKVPRRSAQRIIEAWAILFSNSEFASLEAANVSVGMNYSLVAHTNDVVQHGRNIAASFSERRSFAYDIVALDEMLYLHDVDKLVLFRRREETVERTGVSQRLPHGVIAAFLLKELGFDDHVVSVVCTHATDTPFHVQTPEALIMHYADMASIDLVRMEENSLTILLPGSRQQISSDQMLGATVEAMSGWFINDKARCASIRESGSSRHR